MPDYNGASARRNVLLDTLRALGPDTGATYAELASLTGAREYSVRHDIAMFEEAGWVTSDRGPRRHGGRFTITSKGARLKSVPKYGPERAQYTRSAPVVLPVATPGLPAALDAALSEPELPEDWPAAAPETDPLDRVISLVEAIRETRKHLAELEAELRSVMGGPS